MKPVPLVWSSEGDHLLKLPGDSGMPEIDMRGSRDLAIVESMDSGSFSSPNLGAWEQPLSIHPPLPLGPQSPFLETC